LFSHIRLQLIYLLKYSSSNFYILQQHTCVSLLPREKNRTSLSHIEHFFSLLCLKNLKFCCALSNFQFCSFAPKSNLIMQVPTTNSKKTLPGLNGLTLTISCCFQYTVHVRRRKIMIYELLCCLLPCWTLTRIFEIMRFLRKILWNH
jgi:hypothetical protein